MAAWHLPLGENGFATPFGDELCDHLVALPARERFVFPNDAGFRAMLEQMKTQGGQAAA